MKCSVCRAPVKDSTRVFSSDDDGSHREYEQLCRRCLEAEKMFARRVALFDDGAFIEEFISTKARVPRDKPEKRPAKTPAVA